MRRSTVRIVIACLVLVLVGAFARIDFTVSNANDAANASKSGTTCTARTMQRLSEALVEVADAFEAPPAPNAERKAAVTMIRKKAEAMARQARRCVIQNR